MVVSLGICLQKLYYSNNSKAITKLRLGLSVEAGVSISWSKYVGDAGEVLAVDRFGASAPAEDVFRNDGFTAETVVKRAKKLIP
jgi:transketolase